MASFKKKLYQIYYLQKNNFNTNNFGRYRCDSIFRALVPTSHTPTF